MEFSFQIICSYLENLILFEFFEVKNVKKNKSFEYHPLKPLVFEEKFFLDTISILRLFSMDMLFSFRHVSPVLERNPLAAHAKRWLNGSTAVMREISREPFARTGGLTQKQSLRGFSLTHSGGVPILNACLPFFHGGTTEVKERSN